MAGAIGFTTYNALTESPISSSVTQSLVSQRFALSTDYATLTYNTALGYLSQFEDVSYQFNWLPPAEISLGPPAGVSGLNPVVPEMQAINDISTGAVEFPYSAPVLEDHDMTAISVPDFAVGMPNFFIPAAPDTPVPSFTLESPADVTIDLPLADDIPAIPPLPILKEILPPDEPDFNLPAFDAVMPVDDLTPPDLAFAWNEAEYDSNVFDALRNKILDGILNGGAGMLPEVEAAIYARAASRLDVEAQKNELLAYSDFSSRGSRLPQGALVARLNEIRLQNLLVREDLTNDTMIKSADVAYQYSTFIIERGLNLEHDCMDLHNKVQQRAFEAAKVLVDFAIQQYDIRVRAYAARLDAYKTEAEIFKAKIQAEIARAELYKYIIEGRRLSLEMQGLMVDLYGKQLGAIDTMAKIYATKMDAAKVQAEIGMLGVEKFKALIEAYKAQVQGVTAEYNLYQAQIAGEAEKARMYSYQVDGYKATVDAYKTRSDIDINILRAKLEKGQGEVNIFTALIDKYRAEVQAKASEADNQAKIEGLKVQVFDGEVKKFTAIVAAMVDSYKAETTMEIANADVQVKYGEILSRLESAEMSIQAELIKAKSMVASQLSAAALSSVSAGANLGYSQNRSDGQTTSSSRSESDGYSYSWIQKNCCGD